MSIRLAANDRPLVFCCLSGITDPMVVDAIPRAARSAGGVKRLVVPGEPVGQLSSGYGKRSFLRVSAFGMAVPKKSTRPMPSRRYSASSAATWRNGILPLALISPTNRWFPTAAAFFAAAIHLRTSPRSFSAPWPGKR